MKLTTYYRLILIGLLVLSISACTQKQSSITTNTITQEENEALFTSVLNTHLNAVINKDATALKATMSPNGNMELIQPASEILYTVDSFMNFHQEWFKVPDWTVNTKILSTDIGDNIGVATTEFLYKEPERNGKPYFNRLIVSYTLQKIDDNWYIIKDHASSIEKTKS